MPQNSKHLSADSVENRSRHDKYDAIKQEQFSARQSSWKSKSGIKSLKKYD